MRNNARGAFWHCQHNFFEEESTPQQSTPTPNRPPPPLPRQLQTNSATAQVGQRLGLVHFFQQTLPLVFVCFYPCFYLRPYLCPHLCVYLYTPLRWPSVPSSSVFSHLLYLSLSPVMSSLLPSKNDPLNLYSPTPLAVSLLLSIFIDPIQTLSKLLIPFSLPFSPI